MQIKSSLMLLGGLVAGRAYANDWAGMYERGLIDALEWKTNRFWLI
ncbi:hypothetical protein [Vibrio sp. 1288]|nr:hypothetical protein [Vibrio sp. 1288]